MYLPAPPCDRLHIINCHTLICAHECKKYTPFAQSAVHTVAACVSVSVHFFLFQFCFVIAALHTFIILCNGYRLLFANRQPLMCVELNLYWTEILTHDQKKRRRVPRIWRKASAISSSLSIFDFRNKVFLAVVVQRYNNKKRKDSDLPQGLRLVSAAASNARNYRWFGCQSNWKTDFLYAPKTNFSHLILADRFSTWHNIRHNYGCWAGRGIPTKLKLKRIWWLCNFI